MRRPQSLFLPAITRHGVCVCIDRKDEPKDFLQVNLLE